ncbi:protein unc-13 homolog A-like [Malaclemys terrapin pileata]|uniref:protein unc-13 homolog A-like n=1 Tax=Malaclemys terrapin pileata TaxID=2991368 RepID=UPI0023A7CC6D|nr:protein unc-13 homolog A-like [Malaclemys terrapin pileata]
MDLLCVKVKKGRLNGAADTFNTYVVLKVQNLKSTTINRKGSEPCWEQDFMFEISDVEKGFVVELWKKGLIWDKLLGTLWIPLTTVEYATDEGSGAWWILHSEVIKNGNEICGTKTPTRHEILLDVYFAILNDSDCRSYYRRASLQGACHSHQDTCSSLSPMKSALSMQEKELSNKDQVYISSLAKARWTRAIQKENLSFRSAAVVTECSSITLAEDLALEKFCSDVFDSREHISLSFEKLDNLMTYFVG